MSELLEITVLRKQFEKAGCRGVVALIDYLEAERRCGLRVLKIGSASVDWDGTYHNAIAQGVSKETRLQKLNALPALYLGTLDGLETPLSKITEFSENLTDGDPAVIRNFDRFCADLAAPKEDFEIILERTILATRIH